MIGAVGGFTFVCMCLLMLVLFQLSEIQKRMAALGRVEAKLDRLLENAGIRYDPYAELMPQVAEALQRGNKIEAIKHYREATGAGLKEAKDFVEEVQRRAGSGA